MHLSKDIELGNMGILALKSHADGAKHKAKIKARNTFFPCYSLYKFCNFISIIDSHFLNAAYFFSKMSVWNKGLSMIS